MIELKVKVINEDGSKRLEKKVGPITGDAEICLSPRDPTIKALIDSAILEFQEAVEDVVVTARLTL